MSDVYKHPAQRLCKASPETTQKVLSASSLPSLPENWSHREHEGDEFRRAAPRFDTLHLPLICLCSSVPLERLELSPPFLNGLYYSKVLPVPAWMHDLIKHCDTPNSQTPVEYLYPHVSRVALEPDEGHVACGTSPCNNPFKTRSMESIIT